MKDLESGTYSPLPDFISIIGYLSFDVFTNDVNNRGIYQVSIQGSVPDAYMSPVYMEELLI